MANYIEQRLYISDNQKEKIKLAMKNKEAVTIQVKNVGNDLIALTNRQIDKINKAFEEDEPVKITLSKAQLKHNKNKVIVVFFLGSLLKLAAPILAEEVLPKVFDKVLGHGIFIRDPYGGMYKIKSFGNGLFLSNKSKPPSSLQINGEGVFIRNPEGDDWIEGSGVIHDIAKDMPLLNLIF